MKGFLSAYMAHRRQLDAVQQEEYRDLFRRTTDSILSAIGKKAFKPRASLNAALVDAVMVGVARRIKARGDITSDHSLKSAYAKLLRDKAFQASIARATADEENVKNRLDSATSVFSKVE